MYPEEEKERVREALGIGTCVRCLLGAFFFDVVLPPPFRPPLMLILCFVRRRCP
ncbi:MAG: hypothetical protein QXU64_02030 [Thermofilaceae archaeon]